MSNLIFSNVPKRKVISYSLYLNQNMYTLGLIENLKLRDLYFSEWIVYIYYDKNIIPNPILDKIKQFKNVELYDMSQSDLPPKLWKFLPYSNVERFISREPNTRLSKRESEAITEWINSNKTLHIIRDHPNHYLFALIGKLMGLVINTDLYSLIKSWIYGKNIKDENIDNLFVGDNIYSRYYSKGDLLIHDTLDTYHSSFTKKFPSMWNTEYNFIGEIYNEINQRTGEHKILKKVIFGYDT